MTYPLAASDVAAAAWTTGATAEAKDALKRNKYSWPGTGAYSFVPRHEKHCRAVLEAFVLLTEIAAYVAGFRSVSKKVFMEDATKALHGEPGGGGCVLRDAFFACRMWRVGLVLHGQGGISPATPRNQNND